MRIVVTGGTGFIGTSLVKALLERGDEITILSRSAHPPREPNLKVHYATWNPDDEKSLIREINAVEGVINLAGEPLVKKRWTPQQKEKILKSRVNATQIVARSIREAVQRPRVLINASAVGYYGSHESEPLAEESRSGNDFLSDTCKAWEAHAVRVEDFNVRVIRLRIGIVLARGGGALSMMLPPFKMGLGGWLGGGHQWMSWIHLYDLVRLIVFCLEHESARGAINAVSPQAVTNKAFSMVLAQVLRRPCLMPVPAFVLKILLGEMAQVLLTGQRVVPKKAQELGFSFRYPDIRSAFENILK